uniref:L-rhamnose-binding lectin CSL2-like n=1 Tax=Cyprinus carpio TaxID=7962 RepID=A0A8C1SGP3_CYPCA
MFQSTMLVQKLSGVTLLLLLCQHACFLSATGIAKKSVTCEGGSASLSCPSGFIHILGANYGRTDGKTCSAGRPSGQLLNVKCFQRSSLQTMTTRCNGKKSCSVSAVNSVFKDPCVGTYKYLQVSYECRPLKQRITCEGSKSHIACGKNHLKVNFFLYVCFKFSLYKCLILRGQAVNVVVTLVKKQQQQKYICIYLCRQSTYSLMRVTMSGNVDAMLFNVSNVQNIPKIYAHIQKL